MIDFCVWTKIKFQKTKKLQCHLSNISEIILKVFITFFDSKLTENSMTKKCSNQLIHQNEVKLIKKWFWRFFNCDLVKFFHRQIMIKMEKLGALK